MSYTTTALALTVTATTGKTSTTQTATTFPAYNPTYPGNSASPTPTSGPKKRSYQASASNISNYPKLIKMVEKRQPLDPDVVHVEPYCQKMQVLDNWEIVPIPSVETINIEEIQYPTSKPNNDKVKRFSRDIISDLQSFCICEWTSL